MTLALPAGMVAFGPNHPDYPNVPRDWSGGYVKLDNGACGLCAWPAGWNHGRPRDSQANIIGYYPIPASADPVAPADADVVVTAVDREAAANLVVPNGRWPGFPSDFRSCRADQNDLTQAFARHRHAATERAARVAEGEARGFSDPEVAGHVFHIGMMIREQQP